MRRFKIYNHWHLLVILFGILLIRTLYFSLYNNLIKWGTCIEAILHELIVMIIQFQLLSVQMIIKRNIAT